MATKQESYARCAHGYRGIVEKAKKVLRKHLPPSERRIIKHGMQVIEDCVGDLDKVEGDVVTFDAWYSLGICEGQECHIVAAVHRVFNKDIRFEEVV